jgi:hypothetical protein
LRRYKAGGFIIWFRCILFSALPEVTGPAGIVGACLGPETLRYEFPDMSKEKQLPGDAIRGIIDVGRVRILLLRRTFTLSSSPPRG